MVTQLYTFVKIHQTANLKSVHFPEHKSCGPEASSLKMQRLFFLLHVPSCPISPQALPWACFWFPVTCALHPSHILHFHAFSWTLFSLLIAWITLVYPCGFQLNLTFPKRPFLPLPSKSSIIFTCRWCTRSSFFNRRYTLWGQGQCFVPLVHN